MVDGAWTAAMDELLEIIMRDKAWGEAAPRKTLVAILELQNRCQIPRGLGAADGLSGRRAQFSAMLSLRR